MRSIRIALTVIVLVLVVLVGKQCQPTYAAGCLIPGAYIPIIRHQPHADQPPCLLSEVSCG